MTATCGPASNEEALVRTAAANLVDRFASIDASHIELVVRRFVGEWFAGARVKTFVGIIAERHARIELQQTAFEHESQPARR